MRTDDPASGVTVHACMLQELQLGEGVGNCCRQAMLQELQQGEGERNHREAMGLPDADSFEVLHTAAHPNGVAETERDSTFSPPQAAQFARWLWSTPSGVSTAPASLCDISDEAAGSLLSRNAAEALEEEGCYPQSATQVGVCQSHRTCSADTFKPSLCVCSTLKFAFYELCTNCTMIFLMI